MPTRSLRNGAGKYLTAETFNFKLATAASIMKKKQIWFLEQAEGADYVFIRSHLGKYLAVNVDGNMYADSDDKSEEAQLIIEAQDDGRWCLRSNKYTWYLGNDPSIERNSFESDLQEKHKWTVHLAMHPQVCLFNKCRKAYVHLEDNQMCTNELIPWGEDATVTLHFFADDGTYGLIASNGAYLSSSGALLEQPDESAKFVIVFKDSKVSFKSKTNGKFLTALGAKGTCKATKSAVTSDELFSMEDSFPQLKFTAVNGKKISRKQGVEISASTKETTDLEVFQVEPVGNNKWTFKTCKSEFWMLVDGAVKAVEGADLSSADAQFEIEWIGNTIAMKASNGKYLEQKLNGYIHASADAPSTDSKSVFVYEIINRPKLVLRGEYGFIGTLPSGLLECNKSTPEVYSMHVTQGYCKISHANGKYWRVGDNGVTCQGDTPEQYCMSLHEDSMLCLYKDGKYFEGFQNGAFTLTGAGPGKSTFFEY